MSFDTCPSSVEIAKLEIGQSVLVSRDAETLKTRIHQRKSYVQRRIPGAQFNVESTPHGTLVTRVAVRDKGPTTAYEWVMDIARLRVDEDLYVFRPAHVVRQKINQPTGHIRFKAPQATFSVEETEFGTRVARRT